jgi:hypothetical protein
MPLRRPRCPRAAGEDPTLARLTISLACCNYDRTRALFDGTVGIEGCETIACAMSPEEAFHRAFRFQEFDVSELSLSNYMHTVADGTHRYIAIPAFLSRLFRHSSIYIRTDRGIERPQDLRGKIIGGLDPRDSAGRVRYPHLGNPVAQRRTGAARAGAESVALSPAGDRAAADPPDRNAVTASR